MLTLVTKRERERKTEVKLRKVYSKVKNWDLVKYASSRRLIREPLSLCLVYCSYHSFISYFQVHWGYSSELALIELTLLSSIDVALKEEINQVFMESHCCLTFSTWKHNFRKKKSSGLGKGACNFLGDSGGRVWVPINCGKLLLWFISPFLFALTKMLNSPRGDKKGEKGDLY